MAMAETTSELLWHLSVARDVNVGIYGPITLFEDNQGAIALAHIRKHMRRAHETYQTHRRKVPLRTRRT